MYAKTWFALQVKSPSSLSTDRAETDVVKKQGLSNLEVLAFD